MSIEKAEFQMEILKVKIKHSDKMSSLLSFGIMFEEIEKQKDKGYLQEAYISLSDSLPPETNIDKYISGLILILLVREIEQYFIDILKLIIQKYPEKIGSIEIPINDVIKLSKQEIIYFAAEKYLNEIMYKRPSEYLDEICKLSSIERQKIEILWNYFVEAKARRDLGIHNSWIVNNIYIRKIKETKNKPSFNIGESAEPKINYIVEMYHHCAELIEKFTEEITEKYS
jgi:hypothetical protein